MPTVPLIFITVLLTLSVAFPAGVMFGSRMHRSQTPTLPPPVPRWRIMAVPFSSIYGDEIKVEVRQVDHLGKVLGRVVVSEIDMDALRSKENLERAVARAESMATTLNVAVDKEHFGGV